MPNDPLKTFRTVEPAHFGFGSMASQASQPFVLHHQELVSVTSSGGAPATGVAATYAALSADRFVPWDLRTASSCYPVSVPNAYDRVYIFPAFATSWSGGSVAPSVEIGTYVAPSIVPFGLTPQTRNFSTSNKLNPLLHRLPDDIITGANAAQVNTGFNLRTNGFWIPLSAYASNFSTSNGLLSAAGSTNPTHFLRGQTGAGSAAFLPNDFSLSSSTTTAISTSDSQKANSKVVVGLGTEFQTMGSEEIVVALGSNPSGITLGHPNENTQVYKLHFFLMGIFLG
jgi:hypothetical protein